MRVENVTGPIAHHAEGPVWHPAWGGLRWVDAEAGDLLTLTDDGVRRMHIDDAYLAFVRPRTAGGFVAVGAHDLYLSDGSDELPRRVATLISDPAVRMNDGCCDPEGRLLAGSMAYDATPGAGSLLRIDPDGTIAPLLAAVGVSNGVAFSPSGERAYYVDSLSHRVDVLDFAGGELAGRRSFAAIPDADGIPDGLAVAADGSVWVAVWGGSQVIGFDESGAEIARIPVPVPQVSACAFGGDDLRTLYITTSAQGLGRAHGTEAGSLYAARLDLPGLPVLPFAG
ncbi:SMP-30/gluconolactonase/LRE family protein [Microbacterium capsulatum]|uniref:SMP-30/gluconolactonase/LRE family protein n=1 Tax=Microbacterium capsulatum TaxID=3041921 RepID=A0ABU0XIY2_9MICO|nr:SMP-30/gluconolactonase/LRE family protein [Microbacterium sp. ASV81]MDQ4215099.1 SMP-30/gluconolactonase/LRE family protein [Microbacterium sp. ASV81]